MTINPVSDSEFEEKVLKDKTPVFVDFWAEWCAPCKIAEPVLEDLASSYSGKVDFYKINVDLNPQTAQKFGILSIPTTILFKNGAEAGRQIGFSGKQPYEDLIKKGVI